MKTKKSDKSVMKANLHRHIMVGAALGLYFGMFFRPARDPNFLFAAGLALLVTFVMFLVRLFQKNRPPVKSLLREAPLNLLQYFLILAALEGRHYAYDLGGRVATSILMTCMGAVTGALIYWKSHGKKA